MIKRRLGRTGLEVTEIGFGALEIGRDWAADVNDDPTHPEEKEAIKVLNGVLDAGINFIDTAPAYWFSEEFIGKGISHRRDEYILATKVGEHCDRDGSYYDYSAKATMAFIERSLTRLRTDVIDLIQIHSAPMAVLDSGETWEALDKARQQGKVKHIGMSGGIAEAIRAIEVGGYETVQFPYNLIMTEAEDRLFALAEQSDTGVIIMRGLAGGKLTGKYTHLQDEKLKHNIERFKQFTGDGGAEHLAHLAIQFVLQQKAISTIIFGTRKLDRVQDNLRLAGEILPDDLMKRVEECCRDAAQAW